MNTKGESVPQCQDETTMTVQLQVDSGYKMDKKNNAYSFKMMIYNRCGELGTVKSIKFHEAVDSIDGNI